MPVKVKIYTPRTRLSFGEQSVVNVPKKKKSRAQSKKSVPFSYGRYLLKMLIEFHPDLSLSNKTVRIMDEFLFDIMQRLVVEAANLTKVRNGRTLSSADIQSACKLVFTGEISSFAVAAGTKAVLKYDGKWSKNDE